MALVIITLQDEEDGTVSLGYTTEPVLHEEDDELSNAQIISMIGVHNIMLALQEDSEDETSSIEG